MVIENSLCENPSIICYRSNMYFEITPITGGICIYPTCLFL